MSDGLQVESARDEVDIRPLDVSHHHDVHLREEVKREIVVSVAQDRLLNQNHAAASLCCIIIIIKIISSSSHHDYHHHQ